MRSVWMETVQLPRRDRLTEERKAQAVVIGAGLAGLLTAWRLKERGIEAVVLEAGRTGSGQTGRTTAKITAQHGLIYPRLIRLLGEDGARRYAQAHQAAVGEYRELVEKMGVDCDLVPCPAYLYSRTQSEPLQQEAEACRRLGLAVSRTARTALPFQISEAVRMEDQAVFHPLKFLAALSGEVEIYESSPVCKVGRDIVYTAEGSVEAEHIVFACHYPFVKFPGLYFARMHQERSYVVALEGTGGLDGPYFGVDPGDLSLRPWGELVFVGGGNHRAGENSAGGRFAGLEERGLSLWPGSRAAYRWSAQDCMTLDGLPYLGRYSPARPHWYVATGFGKWGMTTSMVAADLIAAQICGEKHALEEICSPGRFSWQAAGGLMRQSGKSVQGLARSVFFRPERTSEQLAPGEGGIVEHEGRKMAAYRDEAGQLHLISPRCPHMGCQLDWDPDTRTWDCPCHGSRFDPDGILIDGPAQKNAPRA